MRPAPDDFPGSIWFHKEMKQEIRIGRIEKGLGTLDPVDLALVHQEIKKGVMVP